LSYLELTKFIEAVLFLCPKNLRKGQNYFCCATAEVVVVASPWAVSVILKLEDFYVLNFLNHCNIYSNKKCIQ